MAEWAGSLAAFFGLIALVLLSGTIEVSRGAEKRRTGDCLAAAEFLGLAAAVLFWGLVAYALINQIARLAGGGR